MKTIRITLSIIILLAIPQTTFSQVEGWNKTKQVDNLLYIPIDLKSSKTYRVLIPAPEKLKGQNVKSWFLTSIKEMQKPLGAPLRQWNITINNQGGLSSINIFKNKDGEILSVGYLGLEYPNKQTYIVQIVSSLDATILKKYGNQIPALLKDARGNDTSGIIASTKPTQHNETQNNVNKNLTGKEKRLAIESAIRTLPGKGVKASEIAMIWVDSYINVLWGGLDVDTAILFKDGSAYLACKIPPGELNVAKSKSLQPRKWTKWRKFGEGYQIFNNKKGVWKELDGTRAIRATSAEKLKAKFITAGGSKMKGSWKNSIIFMADGRFEMTDFSMNNNEMMGGGETGPSVSVVHKSDKGGTSGSTVISGGNIGGGANFEKKDGSKNTGTYHINGYTIILKHDNG